MRRPPDDAVPVRTDDLSISRGDARVVEGVTFTIEPGRVLAVTGGTGSGKSSLAAVLAGAEEPGLVISGGEAAVAGIGLRARGRARRTRLYVTGYLPQGAGAALPPRLTVADVIGEPITARDRRVNRRALAVRVASLLDEFGLPLGAATKFPYELSAGMRQRVAMARALLLGPRLFLADDPFANLDPEVRVAVRAALKRRLHSDGMAMLMVSGDADAIRELDADVMVMRAGHPVAFGHGTDDLLWTPDGHGDVPTDVTASP